MYFAAIKGARAPNLTDFSENQIIGPGPKKRMYIQFPLALNSWAAAFS
jgi:hypothetical protein